MQMWALVKAAARELLWGLRAVSKEVELWKTRARSIPDDAIRADALGSLTHKRPNVDGAALFWTVPDHRCLRLLGLLVVYETLADFLDSTNERGAAAGTTNGCQLHLALVEAIDPAAPVSDYYRHHPWCDDGGYLNALIWAGRGSCAALPSYAQIRTPLIRAADLAQVQGLNHEPDPTRRGRALNIWAKRNLPNEQDLDWFELASAASAWLTVLVLLALASQQAYLECDGADVYAAYFPWVALTAATLDSYVDMSEDAAEDRHNCMEDYRNGETALQRICELAQRSVRETQTLHQGHRHTVILASMIAMYLSKDSARTRELRATTKSIACAGGSLTQLLLPVLRAWRIANAQRTT
jgi:tetraprenyl-beta-curcumene synthase